MAQKSILIVDPGIDTAFAVALAFLEPEIDVLALAATAGNVSAEQATLNVHTIIGQLDPQRWPRIGAALPIMYELDGTKLHGADGLGNANFPAVSLHAPHVSDRLIVEMVKAEPHEVTIICLGPMTMLARAISREPELPELVRRIICVGGCWRDPGNASPVSEFHVYLDPEATRMVLNCGAHVTLIPLDVTRKVIFSPKDLLDLPAPESATTQFLNKIIPYGIRACTNLYGIEGFHLKDVLAIIALALPKAVTLEAKHVDVELVGDLTRGMIVVDARPQPAQKANVHLATDVDVPAVRDYILRTLKRAEDVDENAF
jgi:inosine-uridine nucleoside N-ribohydrolase